MTKADLHVHSRHSSTSGEWFLQRINALECYTGPETIYRAAKSRGMDFVTITDHNAIEGALLLKELHPSDTFVSVECSVEFPETGAGVHLLVYDLSEAEFRSLQAVRKDIYAVRELLRERRLAHSIAHAIYSENGRLSVEELEKLILLFDVFEGLNAGRNRVSNAAWTEMLAHLTPERIDDLYRRHRIEPFGPAPWKKGLTGGSDDHAGIFIAKAYTVVEASSPAEFVERLRAGQSFCQGESSDYKALALTVYKVVYDLSKEKTGQGGGSLLGNLSRLFFEGRLGLRGRWSFAKVALANRLRPTDAKTQLLGLVRSLRLRRGSPLEEKFEDAYAVLGRLADGYLAQIATALEGNFAKGDVQGLVKKISSFVVSLCMYLPFIAAARHLSASRGLVNALRERYPSPEKKRTKKVLWFTDTISDLNGVAVMLRKIGKVAAEGGETITIAASLLPEEADDGLPSNLLRLPHAHTFHLPGYESYVMKVPSILQSLQLIDRYDPDEIYLSTPGPTGLLGLLAAWCCGIRAVGVYHTDYYLEAQPLVESTSIVEALERYVQWFYGATDEVRVPTGEYLRILEQRGMDRKRMSLFPRAVDSRLFSPRAGGRRFLHRRFRIPEGFTLLFSGRVSKDKNLDFLGAVYEGLRGKRTDVNLVIAGDGPYLPGLQARLASFDRVFFTGKLGQEELPLVYSGADLFVFPSTTDTFGMVVIEALACGLPAVVSDKGGPREIVADNVTGRVLPVDSATLWAGEIERFIALRDADPGAWERMRHLCRARVAKSGSWEAVVRDITGQRQASESPAADPVIAASALFKERSPV